MSRKLIHIAILAVLLLAVGCNKVPGYVIAPDDMAELLADIHTAESVVDQNFVRFPDDSTRMLLKQSIYAKHGYTRQQVDTSFMWYGSHLNYYQDVYARTVNVLEERLARTGAIEAEQRRAETGGDSTDLWSAPRHYVVRATDPMSGLTFDLQRDTTWHSGDSYTWRGRFANNNHLARWTITAMYSDGSIEVLTTRFSGDGLKTTTFFTDSTKIANRITGSLMLETGETDAVVIDSLELIAQPLQPSRYQQRYRQRTYTAKRNE